MKKISMIAMLLCFVIAVSMLAGCGTKTPDPTAEPSVTTEPTEEPEGTPVVVTSTPGSNAGEPTMLPEYHPVTPAPENIKSGMGLGDTFKGKAFKVTPLKAEKRLSSDEGTDFEYVAGTGKTLVAVLVKVENISGKEEVFMSTSSISATVKGQETSDFAYLTVEFSPLDESNLKAGEACEGYLLFEVPSDGGSIKLTYNANLLDGDECGVFEIKY